MTSFDESRFHMNTLDHGSACVVVQQNQWRRIIQPVGDSLSNLLPAKYESSHVECTLSRNIYFNIIEERVHLMVPTTFGYCSGSFQKADLGKRWQKKIWYIFSSHETA